MRLGYPSRWFSADHGENNHNWNKEFFGLLRCSHPVVKRGNQNPDPRIGRIRPVKRITVALRVRQYTSNVAQSYPPEATRRPIHPVSSTVEDGSPGRIRAPQSERRRLRAEWSTAGSCPATVSESAPTHVLPVLSCCSYLPNTQTHELPITPCCSSSSSRSTARLSPRPLFSARLGFDCWHLNRTAPVN